jgi:hypothetical protein
MTMIITELDGKGAIANLTKYLELLEHLSQLQRNNKCKHEDYVWSQITNSNFWEGRMTSTNLLKKYKPQQ